MDITKVIADNLGRWMQDSKTLDTLEKVAKHSGVGFGTVRRIRNNQVNPTIKNIDAIAKAFKRKAADLLAPPLTVYPLSSAATLRAEEIKADEYQVLIGYRHGSAETQDLMRTLAARANEAFEARRRGSLARPRLRLIKG